MGLTLLRIGAVVLLLWALADHPYGYYTILRIVVCIAAAYSAYCAFEMRKNEWVWIMGAVAVVFNPIIPIHADKGSWGVIDVASAGMFIISIFMLKKTGEK